MADKLQLLLEAEKRGILPPDKKPLLDEARRRGLVPATDAGAQQPVLTPDQIAAGSLSKATTAVSPPYNPSPKQRMEDLQINQMAGTKPPPVSDDASIWTKAVDWLGAFNRGIDVAAHGVTWGLSDEAAGLGQGVGAMVTGQPFVPAFKTGMDATNSNIRNFKADNPVVGNALETIGLLTSPAVRLGASWQEAAPSLAGRTARAAVVGAGAGAATGAAYNEGDIADRMKAAGIGAAAGGATGLVLTPAIEGVTAGAQASTKASTQKGATPSVEEIKAASKAEYGNAANAGAIIKPDAIKALSSDIQTDLANFGYHQELQPKVAVILKELDRVGQGNVTAEGVDTMRKIALSVSQSADPAERKLGGMIVGKIDDMMENLKPSDVVMGDATKATEALTKARDLWKTARKAELLDGLVDSGELQGASTNSGGNVQNMIRKKLRSQILENPNNSRMFTADELKSIRQIVNGTWGQNTLRQLGRLAPSSNAWLGILSTFAAPGVGVAVPIVGSASKAVATRWTKGAINDLSQSVREGAYRSAPQLDPANVPFPMQVRQQLINREIRKRLGLLGPTVGAATGAGAGELY